MIDICERFALAADMNGDALTTITDVWLWSKTVFLLPSNFVTAVFQGRDGNSAIAQFFEMNCSTGQSWGGAIFSFLMWLAVLSALSGMLSDMRGKYLSKTNIK